MAATKNLVIDQGATFYANIQFLDTNKTPISLTGYAVRSKMRTSYDSPNAAILVATVTNSSTGNISLYLDAANTSLLHYGRYVYDVEAYLGNSVIRIQEGAITVTPGVSGNSVGSILKQTLNSLVNNNYSVTLDANGLLQLPLTGIQNSNPQNGQISDQYWVAPPNGQVNLASNDGNNYVWVDNGGTYLATAWYTEGQRAWYFDANGTITLPGGPQIITGYPGYGHIDGTATLTGPQVYLTSPDGNAWIGVENGIPVIGTNTETVWVFNYNGSLTFPDGNSQTTAFVSNNYINKSLLKSIVANSMSWSEFQANIAAL